MNGKLQRVAGWCDCGREVYDEWPHEYDPKSSIVGVVGNPTRYHQDVYDRTCLSGYSNIPIWVVPQEI
jgi:hypothetical protein